MGARRRFIAVSGDTNSVFTFTIDTTKIVAGATNGSQLNDRFRIPVLSDSAHNYILRVSDGRADVAYLGTNAFTNAVVIFATPGIYTISLIGRVGPMVFSNGTYGYDKLKLISIDNWGESVNYQNTFLDGCTNCEILATNMLNLPALSNAFFRNIKGFNPASLDNIVVSKVTSATSILSGITTQFSKLFNSFWNSITSVTNLYGGVNVSLVSKVEIISNSVTNASSLFGSSGSESFSGELILSTPNNTNIQALCYYMNVMPSLAKVDVRNVTTNLNFLRTAMSTSKVDETLIAWASLPSMKSGVSWDWKNSKYSNNPTVIAAYNKITTTWGVIFTNLTMA